MADDHKVVALSMVSTLIAASLIWTYLAVVSGGPPSSDLVSRYVLPLVISAITLAIFGLVLFIRAKFAQPPIVQSPSPVAASSQQPAPAGVPPTQQAPGHAKYCMNCGQQILAKASFCPNCGQVQ